MRSQSKGISFIEVLVSLLLMSLILLSLDTLQMSSIREAKALYYYQTANQQISNISERLQRPQENEWYQEVAEWNQENAEVLPQGRGEVVIDNNDVLVEVYWGDTLASCSENKIGLSGCIKREILR